MRIRCNLRKCFGGKIRPAVVDVPMATKKPLPPLERFVKIFIQCAIHVGSFLLKILSTSPTPRFPPFISLFVRPVARLFQVSNNVSWGEDKIVFILKLRFVPDIDLVYKYRLDLYFNVRKNTRE